MDILLRKIEDIVSFKDFEESIFERQSVADELTKLISSTELKQEEWSKFVHFDKFKYTRNLIANGKGNKFGLMILAWGPGQKSPIHDHNGSHCIMKVLEGSLIETLYTKGYDDSSMDSDTSFTESSDYKTDNYVKTREVELLTGQTAYIHDQIGWHRVSNGSAQKAAVSLHLYAPPIEECKTFCEVEGKIRAQASCPYYSVNGQVVQR